MQPHRSSITDILPEERIRLCQLAPLQRLYVVRQLLKIYRPFLTDVENFTTLGALTNGEVRCWDYDELHCDKNSPCLHLVDFDTEYSGRLEAPEGAYPSHREGKQLFLTPTMRILQYRWEYDFLLIAGEPSRFIRDEQSVRVRLTSPTEEELAAVLTGSMVRKVAQVLAQLVHMQRVRYEKKATELGSMVEEADAYIADIP